MGVEVVGASTLAEAADRGARTAVAPGARRDAARHDLRSDARRPRPARAQPATVAAPTIPDLAEVRGQLEARRALEIALAGGHGMLMTRTAGRRQDAARADDPRAVAAARRRGRAVGLDRGIRGRRGTGPRAPPSAAVPRAAPHAVVRGDGRWRPEPHARRDHPSRRRGPVPRRARRVRSRRARGPAPAARGGAGRDRPGRAHDDVPVAVPADRRDEPVPVRLRRLAARRDAAAARHGDVERYGRRVSGPLRDRIDLWVTMPRMSASAIVATRDPEGSSVVAARIAAARARAGPRSGRPQRPAARPGAAARVSPVGQRGGPGRRPRRGRAGERSRHGTAAAGRPDDRRPRRFHGRGAGPPRRGRVVPLAGDPRGRGVGILMLGVGAEQAGTQRATPRAAVGRRAPTDPYAAERDAWAVLTCAHGLGPVGFAALLARFGTGRAILEVASGPAAVERLMATPADHADRRDPAPDPRTAWPARSSRWSSGRASWSRACAPSASAS